MLKNVLRGSKLFRIVQRGSILLILREKPCKGTKKNWNLKENKEKMHFFSKLFGHVKKKQYLCTRFRERKHAGCSSARLECLLWEQEVVSSNLAIPTNLRKTYGFVSLFFVFLGGARKVLVVIEWYAKR